MENIQRLNIGRSIINYIVLKTNNECRDVALLRLHELGLMLLRYIINQLRLILLHQILNTNQNTGRRSTATSLHQISNVIYS